MKKKNIPTCFVKSLFVLVVLLVMLLALTGCRADFVTIGSLEEYNSTEASMRYRVFDGSKEYQLRVSEENPVIQVRIETLSGSLDIYIVEKGGKKAEAVYEGKNVPSSSFSVTVPAAGIYTVHLEASHHEGSFCFQLSDVISSAEHETAEARSARLAEYQFAL